ncbi:10 kDa chaperonin 2, chloroplastic [Orobanche gracilis]
MAAASLVSFSGPFTSRRPNFHSLSNKSLTGSARCSLRVNVMVKKYEPTKVVPQADRVLIRLEALPEVAKL